MPVFYQRTWNGVDLLDVAADPSRLDRGVPNPAFYAEYYRRLRGAGNRMPRDWWDVKERNSRLLMRWIEIASGRRDPHKVSVISIGAGLGVVELPLIKDGYSITLHEVQDESLQYAVEEGARRGLRIDTVTGPLSKIGRRFDMAYLGTCEYCLPDEPDYRRFLADVRELLQPKGRVTALDYEPGMRSYLAALSTRLRGATGIVWGRLRSASERVRAFRAAGFRVEEVEFHDAELMNIPTYARRPSRLRVPLRSGVAVVHANRQE